MLSRSWMAALSTNQETHGAKREDTRAAGKERSGWGLRMRASTGCLAAPSATKHNAEAEAKVGKVKVIRSAGGLGEEWHQATRLAGSSSSR